MKRGAVPAWVTSLAAESRNGASVTEFKDTVRVDVPAGDFVVSNSVMTDPSGWRAYGRYSIRVRTPSSAESILAAQYDDPAAANDAKLAESLWRDACAVLRTGVRPPKRSSIRYGAPSMLQAVKMPLAIAVMLTHAEQLDPITWLEFGAHGAEAYAGHRFVLCAFAAPGTAPGEHGGLQLLRAGAPDTLGFMVRVK